jgi:hypothetical protein
MKTYKDASGIECVLIENADGSTWSGLKFAYEEEQAKKIDAKAPKVVDEAAVSPSA